MVSTNRLRKKSQCCQCKESNLNPQSGKDRRGAKCTMKRKEGLEQSPENSHISGRGRRGAGKLAGETGRK